MAIDLRDVEKIVGKEVAKALSKQPDDVLMKLAQAARDGLKLKLKTGVFFNKSFDKKEAGVVAEIWESKSNKKLLDGISLDLGITNKNMLAGAAKDLKLDEMEFSVGVYAAFDQNQIIDTLKSKSSEVKPQLRIGITMELK